MGLYNEPRAHHHQSLSTFNEFSIEKFDMVSIDPNCPKHGRYSLTSWLQKGAKMIGLKDIAIYQIYPKAKTSQNHRTKRIKQLQKGDGIRRSISSNFSKHILDKDVVEKPSRMEVHSTLKKYKNKNLEFNVLKQIETNTTINPSILSQKQPNTLLTYDHQNNSILQSKQTIDSKVQMARLNRKNQCISEQVLLESNDNKRMSVKITSIEREKCETLFEEDLIPNSNKGLSKDTCKCPKTYTSQYRRMCYIKGLDCSNCFNSCKEVTKAKSKNRQHGAISKMITKSKISFVPQEYVHEETDKFFNDTTIKFREDDTQSTSTIATKFNRNKQQLMAYNLFEIKKLEQVEQQLKWFEYENNRLANETQIDLIRDEPRICTPTQFTIEEHQMTHNMIAIDEVEQTKQFTSEQQENESLANESRIKLVNESNKCAPLGFSIDEHQSSYNDCNLKELKQSEQQLECVQYGNDNLVDETSTCALTRFTIEEQQTINSVFDIKELEKTQQRLEKIVHTSKSLQLKLNNHSHCDISPIEKVHLSKVQVLQRNEAQEWLSNKAIERATHKISKTCQGGKVYQLVQAFESIK